MSWRGVAEVPPMAGLRSFSAKGGSTFGLSVARNDMGFPLYVTYFCELQ